MWKLIGKGLAHVVSPSPHKIMKGEAAVRTGGTDMDCQGSGRWGMQLFALEATAVQPTCILTLLPVCPGFVLSTSHQSFKKTPLSVSSVLSLFHDSPSSRRLDVYIRSLPPSLIHSFLHGSSIRTTFFFPRFKLRSASTAHAASLQSTTFPRTIHLHITSYLLPPHSR